MTDSASRQLRRAAREVLSARGSEKGGTSVIAKDIFLVLHSVVWYAAALYLGQVHTSVAALLAVPLALSLVAIMFGVMHDGSHRSISETGLWDRLGAWTLILGGASAIGWRQEHVVKHHGQTNVLDEDPDLETGGWLRFHPAQRWRRRHRWQAYYAPLLYSLVALRWIWFEDFDDLVRNSFGMRPLARLRHAAEVLVAKLLHVVLMVVVPLQLWEPVAVGVFYLTFMLVVGLTMSLTFVAAHVGDVQAFYDHAAAARSWAHAQLASTANFAVNNRLLGWFFNGLNLQIEHHLFPAVSPKHYRSLLPVVKRWAQDQGVTYHEFPTVRAALAAHFRHLSSLATPVPR